jgi:hypothetical protein
VADETARHDRHELELVAAHAAGEATGTEQELAEALIDSCDRCFDLARDLRALTLRLQDLPDAEQVAATQRAPRDFRITAEQAAALRPAAPVARWRTRLSLALASVGRPLGATLATLGVVGLLVGTLSFGAGSPATLSLEAATQAPGADGAFGNPQLPAPAASKDIDVTAVGPVATSGRELSGGAGGSTTDSGSVPQNVSTAGGASAWLFGGSVARLVLGLGLIVIATRGRTRRDRDPGPR